MSRMYGILAVVLVGGALLLWAMHAGRRDAEAEAGRPVVVCYAALDEEFSRPILERFEEESGLDVRMKFDTESTKSVGLANALLAQGDAPECDVFWNNEILNTLRLKAAGRLATYRPEAAKGFPDAFRDPEGTWTGFAARCRVLLINTDLVSPEEAPERLSDLVENAERWKGKVGIAKPLFGTTATWLAVLYQRHRELEEAKDGPLDVSVSQLRMLEFLFREEVLRVLSGNKACAQAVGSGTLHAAFTDTDDAVVEKEVAGHPVKLLYLDHGPDDPGTLFIPNTLSILRNAPHEENAKRLVEYLLSAEVEAALARGRSAQIPVNPAVAVETRVKTPKEIKAMRVDWDAAAALFDEAMDYVRSTLLER